MARGKEKTKKRGQCIHWTFTTYYLYTTKTVASFFWWYSSLILTGAPPPLFIDGCSAVSIAGLQIETRKKKVNEVSDDGWNLYKETQREFREV